MGKVNDRYKFPSCPIENEEEHHYPTIGLQPYSLIYTYFGIPIDKQLDLDSYSWNRLAADAAMLKLMETEGGREYLENCWYLEQVEPDRKRLREQFS